MNGVTLGLIVGAIFAILYIVTRYKKEDITAKFLNEKCTNKRKIYVYWSRNNPASKRPVPVFIDREFVGHCKKGEVATFDLPKKPGQKLTVLVQHNVNAVELPEKGPIYVLVNHLGKCEQYFCDEVSNG